jgi:phospholipase C
MDGAQKITRIFVLVLENRSFDHVFAGQGWAGTRPDGSATTLTVAPASVRADLAQLAIDGFDFDPPHEFADVHRQIPALAPADWRAAVSASLGSRVTTAQLPQATSLLQAGTQVSALRTLAQEFAVCDQWYASVPGPTWPNRFFFHAASSNGLYDSPSSSAVAGSFSVDGYEFDKGTVYQRLDRVGVPWRVYYGSVLPQVFALQHMTPYIFWKNFSKQSRFAADLARSDFPQGYTFIEPDYGHTSQDFLGGDSQHPRDAFLPGEVLVKQVYEAIRNSAYWNESLLIITYDEHGGIFDSQRSANAVRNPGDSNRYAKGCKQSSGLDFDFTSLGMRVPAVVVSPLIPRGTIDQRVHEHASVPATVLRRFGGGVLTSRDADAQDCLDLLSLAKPRSDAPTTLPLPSGSALPKVVRGGPRQLAAARPRPAREQLLAAPADHAERSFAHLAIKYRHQKHPRFQHQRALKALRTLRTSGQVREFTATMLRDM